MDAHISSFEYEGCSTDTLQANKLCRRDGPETSRDAAEKMVESGALNRQEQWVYDTIVRYLKYYPPLRQRKDFTTKDISYWTDRYSYDKAYDICRKRFSGLERKGKIELVQRTALYGRLMGKMFDKDGKPIYKRRDGCRVWRLL